MSDNARATTTSRAALTALFVLLTSLFLLMFGGGSARADVDEIAVPTAATGATAAVANETSADAAAKKRAYSGPPRFMLAASGSHRYRGRNYVLPRTLLEIRGTVGADLDGQIVTLVIKRNGRKIKSDRVRLTTKGGKSSFRVRFRAKKKGKHVFRVSLTDDQQAVANAGNGVGVTAVRTNIRRGQSGVAIRVFQQRLAALKYVVPTNGKYDAATARAFMAFRKNNFLSRRESAGKTVAKKLAAGKGGFKLRHPKAGRHVEVSIKRQVMVFADKGRVQRIYHVSTGAPSTPTIRGTYRVYRKDFGTNAKGMVHSAYFIRGYAIHGYSSVPNFNASHGCVRVPIPNAVSIFNWINMGTRIDTYY